MSLCFNFFDGVSRRSRAIDRELAKERAAAQKIIRILLVGESPNIPSYLLSYILHDCGVIRFGVQVMCPDLHVEACAKKHSSESNPRP